VRHPTNPYVAGAALRGEKGFFGRRARLRRVERELRNPATSALVLFGQRRIGKTSLLMQLQRTLPVRSFLPVYFDLQDQAARPLAQVLADLADTAAERADLPLPDPDAFDDAGRFFRRAFLPQLYRAVGRECRPVFLLDEFDVLVQGGENGLPETAAARALFPFLRRLMAEDPRPAFVFVVGRQAGDLSLDFTATFKTALVQEVWVLDREAASELVLQAEANGTLRFTDQAVARILDLTSCHPYLTQLLCQRMWERAYRDDPSAPPSLDVPQVEAAISDALEAGGQALAWVWSGLGPAEKIYVAALGEAADEGQAIPEDRIIEMLAAHAARLRTREVEAAPHDLVKRRVLEMTGERAHRFTLELFRRWVRKNEPLRKVKDELDRVEPVAERLYGIGRDFFKQRQWETAARYFLDALKAYPNHFRARLYLGEALLELGQLDAAMVELKRAHELDQAEAKFALARAVALARAPADVPSLLIDDGRGRVYLGEREVHLSRLEYLVLHSLGQKAGRLMSKNGLAQAVRAHEGYGRASVDAAIYRLRKKLGDSARNPTYLETRRGQGYVLHNATFIPQTEGTLDDKAAR
jgi:DNA-binding winged helix-turn-helix (wHTH) protein